MLILALDTSTTGLSVALMEDEYPLAECTLVSGSHHSETLLSTIDWLTSISCRKIEDVGLIVCTTGPGSFTGLRIGISTAKGLAFALNKGLVGVSSLAALAFNEIGRDLTSCPMLDARRSQLYYGQYRLSQSGSPETVLTDCVGDIDSILAEINDRTLFVGEGALKYREKIRKKLGEKALFAAPQSNRIMASSVGILGFRLYLAGYTPDISGLKPVYLRPAQTVST